MFRPSLSLAVALCSLVVISSVRADDAPVQPLLASSEEVLDLPPVLPPNDSGAVSLSVAPESAIGTPIDGANGTGSLSSPLSSALPAPPQPTDAALDVQLPIPTAPAIAGPIGAPPIDPRTPVAGQGLNLPLGSAVSQSEAQPILFYSRRLGAKFQIETVTMPQFGTFMTARIVSNPAPESPLHQLGLNRGDLITRLDGIAISCPLDLDDHIFQTGVRFIRGGEQTVCQGMIFVDPNILFISRSMSQIPEVPSCRSAALVP